MSELIQIILINLMVSCDNVGVIALATRNLPPDKAAAARRIGIGLSLVMKILFIAVTGFLFTVPWLHIRIIGGILLIYVTFSMLRQNTQEPSQGMKGGSGQDSFFLTLVSIIAADISMSLDNVIAILGVVSADGHPLRAKEISIVFWGLLVCVPVLLWFSGTVSRLMEQYHLLSYLCAGYLIYTAVKMTFEDEMIKMFFERIQFSFAVPSAALCGVLMVIYGFFREGRHPGIDKVKRHLLLPLYCAVVVYSLVSVVVISYLNTKPVIDGRHLSVEAVYGFPPYGVNGVYVIGTSADMLTLCAIVLASISAKECGRKSYKSMFLTNMKGMAVIVLLELTVCTAGLVFTFGLGTIHPLKYIFDLLLELLLLFTYTSVFCMLSAYIPNRTMMITVGLLYRLLESIGAAIIIKSGKLKILAEFFPSYHIAAISGQVSGTGSKTLIIIIALLIISLTSYLGHNRCQLQK